MSFARKELGFKGGFIRPNPYNDKLIHDPMYEPFWAAAEDLDFAIGFHEGAGGRHAAGRRRPLRGPRRAAHHHPHDGDDAGLRSAVIWGGVCERHPKLRVGFLESGGGWIAPWLDRMDRHFDDQGFNDSGLKTRPSEMFQRNCWISFEPVEGSLQACSPTISAPNKIMWATDYPHPDGFFPGAPEMVREAAGRRLGRDQAAGHGRRREGLLRAELSGTDAHSAETREKPHEAAGARREQGRRVIGAGGALAGLAAGRVGHDQIGHRADLELLRDRQRPGQDQIAGAGAEDRGAEDAAVAPRDDLDLPVGVALGLGAVVVGKRPAQHAHMRRCVRARRPRSTRPGRVPGRCR